MVLIGYYNALFLTLDAELECLSSKLSFSKFILKLIYCTMYFGKLKLSCTSKVLKMPRKGKIFSQTKQITFNKPNFSSKYNVQCVFLPIVNLFQNQTFYFIIF